MRALRPPAERDDYDHAEGNGDAHLRLGRGLRIFFCEFDGPRSGRTVSVTPLAGASSGAARLDEVFATLDACQAAIDDIERGEGEVLGRRGLLE